MGLPDKSETSRYAEFYVGKGLRVFPCWPRAKNPIPKNGLYAATTDLAQIAKWWPDDANNVAIATGAGIVVIDLDNDADRGKYGDETWNEWEQGHGQVPDTWECLTGGGGRHLYFRCNDERITTGTSIAPGIDFRGNGGYVIAPPSVHPSGKRYEWEVSHHPRETPLADLPEWLHAILLRGAKTAAKATATDIPDKIPEGARNAEMFRLASSLRARGLSVEAIFAAVMEENKRRCDPPLAEAEVRTICSSAGRYEKGCTRGRSTSETDDRKAVNQVSIESTERALQELGITVRYNLLLKEVEVSGLPGCYSKENAAIVLPPFLIDYLKACGTKGITRQNVEAYLDCIADKNRYNPIKDYLLSGNWDGEDRLPEIYRILGVENERHQTYIKKWLIQCVAIGLNDGERPIGADGALVLQGEQGTGKTSFFRILAPFDRAFVEGAVIDMHIKDTQILATKGWITELGELDSTIKKEQMSLKAFITRTEDRIRMPYAKVETISRRRTSFCGTVNPADYLRDETGSRRFWTVPIEKIDKKRLFSLPREWINQLWFQTYHLYLQNPSGFRLTDEEMSALQEANHEFEQPLPYELEVLELLDYSIPRNEWEWWSAAQLAEKIGLKGEARAVGRAVSQIVKKSGHPWEKDRRKLHGLYQFFVPVRKTMPFRVVC